MHPGTESVWAEHQSEAEAKGHEPDDVDQDIPPQPLAAQFLDGKGGQQGTGERGEVFRHVEAIEAVRPVGDDLVVEGCKGVVEKGLGGKKTVGSVTVAVVIEGLKFRTYS